MFGWTDPNTAFDQLEHGLYTCYLIHVYGEHFCSVNVYFAYSSYAALLPHVACIRKHFACYQSHLAVQYVFLLELKDVNEKVRLGKELQY